MHAARLVLIAAMGLGLAGCSAARTGGANAGPAPGEGSPAPDAAAPDAAAPDAAAPDAVAPDAVAPDAVAPDAAARGEPEEPVVEVASMFVRCGGELRSCTFRGKVRAIRPALHRISLRRAGQVRGLLVVLDGEPSTGCAQVELGGVRVDDDGPLLQGGSVEVGEVFVALPPGTALPFREGDALCGSVRSFSLGYELGYDELVARPDGEVLLAGSDPMPRDPSPLPGWTFTFGPRRTRELRDEGYWYNEHDLRVRRGGQEHPVPLDQVVELGGGSGGGYSVSASGYTTQGRLAPWMAWLGARGYGFSLVQTSRAASPP